MRRGRRRRKSIHERRGVKGRRRRRSKCERRVKGRSRIKNVKEEE